jgi:hypothetical protein
MAETAWLTLPRAAEHLDISVDAVRRLVRQGKLPKPIKVRDSLGWVWSDDGTMLGGFRGAPEHGPDGIAIDDILKAAHPLQARASGIYFLLLKKKIIYIGQAVNVFARIGDHARTTKDFDAWTWIPCPRDNLLKLESQYIQWFRPPLNKAGLCGIVVSDD